MCHFENVDEMNPHCQTTQQSCIDSSFKRIFVGASNTRHVLLQGLLWFDKAFTGKTPTEKKPSTSEEVARHKY